MADIDDRWTRLDRATGERVRTARYGTGKRWAARWRDAADRQRSRSFDRKADAERFLSGIRADLARGTYVDPHAGKITLRKYAAQWLAAQTFDPNTRQTTDIRIRTQILPTLGDMEMRALRPSVVRPWLADQAGRYAPSTVGVALKTLSAICGAAVEDGVMASNPCRSRTVRPPAVPATEVVPWPVPTVRVVAGALPARFAAVPYAGAGLGLRQGELWGLAVDDVDFLRHVVHVRRQVKRVGNRPYFALPKGGKVRDVPLGEPVAQVLAEHLRVHGTTEVTLPWLATGQPHTAALLFAESGTVVSRWSFGASWKSALAAAGVIPPREPGKRWPAARRHGLHALRHTYASVLLADGVDVRTLAEFMGHADAAITLRTYVHLMPQASDRGRLAIERAFSAGGAPDVRQADA